MTDTAKQASEQEKVVLSADALSDVLRQVRVMLEEREAEIIALREEVERLRSALKKLFQFAETPNPEAWPNGYGAYWNYRNAVMGEAEAALRE